MEYKPPFTINDNIINLLAEISELVGQVSVLHKAGISPRLNVGNIMYEEFDQKRFTVGGHEGILISPHTLRPDRRYIWRTEEIADRIEFDR